MPLGIDQDDLSPSEQMEVRPIPQYWKMQTAYESKGDGEQQRGCPQEVEMLSNVGLLMSKGFFL